jgi:hypothetical protein
MSMTKTGNFTHDNNCYLSEMQKQVAISAATTQAAARSIDTTDYRARLVSGKATGCGIEPYLNALRELGPGQ